ncbi:hypothetical protein D3C86_1551230 [compost metagenome]
MPAQRHGARLHQAVHAGLGRGVVGLELAADQGRDGADRHDRAAPSLRVWALLDHLVGGGLNHEVGAVQIDLHRPTQGLDRHVEEGVEGANPGVGHEDIHPPERLDRPGDKARRAFRLGHVGVEHDGLAPQGLDLGDHFGGDGVVTPGVDGDVRALARGLDRRRPSDTPRCARDQDDLVLKQHGGSGVFLRIRILATSQDRR